MGKISQKFMKCGRLKLHFKLVKIFNMDSIQKFYSDIEKTKKFYRANNGGNYNGMDCCQKICDKFASDYRSYGSISNAFSDYWFSTYINTSQTPSEEPTPENVDRLAAMLSLMEGTRQLEDKLSAEDWSELCETVKYEAEDMPIDMLNDMMAVFLEKGALS